MDNKNWIYNDTENLQKQISEISERTGYSKTEIDDKLNLKADKTTTDDLQTQITQLDNNKADIDLLTNEEEMRAQEDERLEGLIDSLDATKADQDSLTQEITDRTNEDLSIRTDVNAALELQAQTLQAEIAIKANKDYVDEKLFEKVDKEDGKGLISDVDKAQITTNMTNIATIMALLQQIQKETLPTPSASELGKIYQYVGITTDDYKKGYFYQCYFDNETGVYEWVNIKVQEGGGGSGETYTAGDGIEITPNNIIKCIIINDTLTGNNTTWSSQELESRFAAVVGTSRIEVLPTKPDTGINNTLYYIGTTSPYNIWLYANDKWYDMGTTAIDLSNYYTKAEVIALLAEYIKATEVYTKAEIDTMLLDYAIANTVYTKNETQELLNNKEDKFTPGQGLTMLTDTRTLQVKVDDTTIKIDSDGKLYVDSESSGSYEAGSGINISGKVISAKVDNITIKTKSDGTMYNVSSAPCWGDIEGDIDSQTDLKDKLDAKANVGDSYTKAEEDALLADKSNIGDSYTKAEEDAALALKADKGDSYTKEQSDDTFIKKSGDEVNGSLKFNVTTAVAGNSSNSFIRVNGGDVSANGGAYLSLTGKDSSYKGIFTLGALNADAVSLLIGKPDGTLTWADKNVLCRSPKYIHNIQVTHSTNKFLYWSCLIITDSKTAFTRTSLAAWLKSNGYTSITNVYCMGMCGTTGTIQVTTPSGSTYVANIATGLFSANGTDVSCKVNYNGSTTYTSTATVTFKDIITEI